MRASTSASGERVPRYAWYVLAVLALVYVFNFLDRTLIYILFAPIKKEMALSDLQLALLGATSFVIFYTLLGIPFGRLADRANRKNLIAGGLAVWSLFSGLTGFATGFWGIFLCRVMVGVGEATLGPAALSLIADYFPVRMRATVNAIFSAGIPLGAGLAFFLGGAIGQNLGWRWAFWLLGFPGLALAAVVFFLREPERGKTEAPRAAPPPRGWSTLIKIAALRYHHLGYGLFAGAGYSLSVWFPLFLNRVHGMTLAAIGVFAGVTAIVGGVPGTIFGGWIADKFRAGGRGGRMRFGAAAALVCAPLWLVLIFSPTLGPILVANFLLLAFALAWLGPAAADVHEIAGPDLRGLAVGIYFFTVNLLGNGLVPPVIGRLNDLFGVAGNPQRMRLSLLLCPALCLGSALLLWLGSRRLERGETA
ncbi:MAG: MFS transporter [Thermoanaerobaculia bacterium]|nr:MFS transporter [Thermoanaerobaculia bacterium]